MEAEKEKELIATALEAVLAGESLSEDVLYALVDVDTETGVKALLDAAETITRRFNSRTFDSCSIVNARSGRCSEDCKWCAQSGRHRTGCATYDLVDEEEAMTEARHNAKCGVHRFSLVASGRAVKGHALRQMCHILKRAKEETGIFTCASLGLIGPEEFKQLYDSGVRRYHCNLETAPSHFAKLCTTHTIEDKLATINAAHEAGLEVCSGGILGMGENRRQRMEFAITLRKARPVSIPINLLSPIAGTPLENAELISDREILIAIALFRFAHPATELRFAGGRSRLSREMLLECLRVGINGGVTGDLLTTTGSTIASDKQLVADADYEF